MRICIFTLGTRGDVQPYVALAKAAITRGYQAVICTGESFREFVTNNGVEFQPTTTDLMAVANSPEGKAILNDPVKNWRLAMRYSKEVLNPAYRKTLDDFFRGAAGADIILYHPKALGAVDIALHYGIPCVSLPPVPITYPTPEFPNLALTTKNLGAMLNKLSYQVNAKAEQSQMQEINDFRQKTLHLPKRKAGIYTYRDGTKEIPTLYPVSPSLFPDVTSWEGHVFCPGFFFLESVGELDADLEAFLEAGPKPIVVTFSSMPLKAPEKFLGILEETLRSTGNRAILLTGNSGMEAKAGANLFVTKGAPHDQLFPRAKGVLHHGGVGTLAAACRSGVPQLIMPCATDQPFWAARMQKLGYAPAPLSEKTLNADALVEAFRNFDNADTVATAAQLAEAIQQDNGATRAVTWLEQLINDNNG